MSINPYLKKLGFSDTDRVVIIHTDDIGMSHASNAAFIDLWEFGLISSGAAMVPCSWFPEIAQFCRTHPDVDMGVHLTLNCEYDSYRWGALSTRDASSGLLDADGYLYKTSAGTYAHGDPDAVLIEIRAQLKQAQASGIVPTHLDTHMGTVIHPRFANQYIQLAQESRIPAFVQRGKAAELTALLGIDSDQAAKMEKSVNSLEEQGVPTFDVIHYLPLDQPAERVAQAKQYLSSLPVGISHFIIHPAKDTPELRAITPPDWPSRVADYEAFMSTELRDFVRNSGLQVIGYSAIRDIWQKSLTN